MVTDNRTEMAEPTAQAIVDAGGRAAAYPLDVMDEDAVEATLTSVVNGSAAPTSCSTSRATPSSRGPSTCRSPSSTVFCGST